MNPEQSHKLVKQTFQADFDRQRFIEFIDKLLKRVDFAKQFMQSGSNVRRAFVDKVSSFERIGQYTDSDGKKIDILIVNLKRDLTLERGRTGLRNFAADYLQSDRGIGKSAVLIAYVSSTQTDWRFSYVTLEKDLRLDGKGRFKEEVTKLTPARRYSFLVGKNENSHTAQRQFFELLTNPAPKLQNVEEAFNIEKVTKEFFAEYKLLFEKVRDELDKLCRKNKAVRDEFISKGMCVYATDEDGEELLDRSGNKIKEPFTDDFAKKLLGQIVFLYFLQKKGWFGVERDNRWGTGDKHFLRTLFSANASKTNFFDNVLEPLFYNALAVKREHDWSDRFNCKIPFLNGGLFEPLNGYDWVHTELVLPDSLFSNWEISPQGDRGTGILDVFDRYNFTINEAEPLEVEVAVDPEMLGKIFENLLPENIRHGSGTYYTPRVIVAYMCQQSLVNYLSTKLKEVPREDLETFIRFGSQQRDYTEAGTQSQAEKFLPQSVIDNATDIDEKLKHVTVCDPAVGSGAFPVGMMLEIVQAREALQAVEGIERLSQYDLKRETIENSLYGVDMDSGAVEIAKLRLWLSLIVDEADFKRIEPLPNLDYKIMQGNSLLDEFHGVKLIDETIFKRKKFDREARIKEIDIEIAQLTKDLGTANVGKQSKLYQLTKSGIAELIKKRKMVIDGQVDLLQSSLFAPVDALHQKLEDLKRKHKEIFDETRKEVKEKLRSDAEKLEWEFIEEKLKAEDKQDELKELFVLRSERRKDYFLWHLNFPEIFEGGGFDVVIGNPPYVKGDAIVKLKPQLRKNYKAFTGNADLYVYFIEKGINLLRDGGVVSLITPNKWTQSNYGIGLRKLTVQFKFIEFIDFGELAVFEDVSTFPSILLISKLPPSDSLNFLQVKELKAFRSQLEFNHIPIRRLTSDNWDFSANNDFLTSLEENFKPLGETIGTNFLAGVKTGNNRLLILDERTVKLITNNFNAETELYRPICFGREINRYGLEYENLKYVFFPYSFTQGKNKLLRLEDYPNSYRYFVEHKSELSSRAIIKDGVKKGTHKWYELQQINKNFDYDLPKLIYPDISLENRFLIDPEGVVPDMTCFFIPESRVELLALFNSRMFKFLASHYCPILGDYNKGGRIRYKSTYVQKIPIPTFTTDSKTKLKNYVNEIIVRRQKHHRAEIADLEKSIDEEIYRLYGLAREEVKIVEANT